MVGRECKKVAFLSGIDASVFFVFGESDISDVDEKIVENEVLEVGEVSGLNVSVHVCASRGGFSSLNLHGSRTCMSICG